MSRIRPRNTSPELAVRKLLFKKGYRYRLHPKTLPGKPDIVFPSRHVAIFVHGCFWHGHQNCAKARLPKTNIEFWSAKIKANIARDANAEDALRELGWSSMTVWQCELKNAPELVERIKSVLAAHPTTVKCQ